jgi:hypothetical protein
LTQNPDATSTGNDAARPAACRGPEADRLDHSMSGRMDAATRQQVWRSVDGILQHGPLAENGAAGTTSLALGFVQSGKTTSITALIAAGADNGYRVIVALLGGTNLLLDQNRARLEKALGIGARQDYVWVTEGSPSGPAAAKRIADWLQRDRVVFVPVLKHAGRIRALTGCLARLADAQVPVLIVDDEADQASLNTQGMAAESKTYEALRELREAVPNHLYVQYTATPYAPLLLEADDLLSPQFVEFLQPGPGYTGGREFFVDFADRVVRDVPALDEQAPKNLPLELPGSLVKALGSFIVGAALLLTRDPAGAPVSMLVHSTQRNDVQARYHFLLERQIAAWRRAAEDAVCVEDLPDTMLTERAKLVGSGAEDADDDLLLDRVRLASRESTLWLVNSASALNKVDWTVAPLHILVGGNKLDRGYTVEGLTVTYMNRPTTTQVDTLEQRARAFGYRRDQLPYCQFFASKRTVKALRDIVYTEYDLRAQLQDHVESGGTVHSWAQEVGLLLPEGMKPTRAAVVQALSSALSGWHSLRRPVLDAEEMAHNDKLVTATGLREAPHVDYGRLAHRTIHLPLSEAVSSLVEPWAVESYSPSWRHADIVQALRRHPHQESLVPVVLLEEKGQPRLRRWDDAVGFVNLFQGRDNAPGPGGAFYPGDRAIPDVESNPDDVVIQVHHVARRDMPQTSLLTLAVYLGSRPIVRKM